VAVPKPQAEMAALLGEAANQERQEALAKAAMVVFMQQLLAAAAQASTLQVVPVHKVFRQVMAK
jgi:hypothetical protein